MFSAIKQTDLVEQLGYSPVNLFNVLSLVENKANVPLNADWQIFKGNENIVLFDKVIKEYGTDVSLQKVIDYLLELDST